MTIAVADAAYLFSVCAVCLQGMGTGYYAMKDFSGLGHIALESSLFLGTLASLLTSGISFGHPQLGRGAMRRAIYVLVALFVLYVFHSIGAALGPLGLDVLNGGHAKLITVITWFIVSGFLFLSFRGFSLFLHLSGHVCLDLFVVLRSIFLDRPICFQRQCNAMDETVFLALPGYVLMYFACIFTHYMLDQRLAFCITFLPILSYHIGVGVFFGLRGLPAASTTLSVGLIYISCLVRRRRRRLPPGLSGAKFVRLGYLREILSEGGHIRRCQELPLNAFGESWKASRLVMVSHRWLHPYLCDIVNETHTQGIKLEALVFALEERFSPARPRARRLKMQTNFYRTSWYECCFVGGWDVLIFFDYMSIPQVGFDPDSDQITPRTSEETAIFNECLPHMGALYSMFPVLILTATSAGDLEHKYEDSGWCTCEFTISTLGGQTKQFSSGIQRTLRSNSMINLCEALMDKSTAGMLKSRLHTELDSKSFLHETDRKIAQGIVSGFLIKRTLVDAVRRGCKEDTESLLSDLQNENLLEVLDEPIDEQLNTLLHLAVKLGNVDLTKALLKSGACSTLANYRGDTPAQWFMLPRLSKAAIKCRVDAANIAKYGFRYKHFHRNSLLKAASCVAINLTCPSPKGQSSSRFGSKPKNTNTASTVSRLTL